MTGFAHLIVPAADFTLITDPAALSTYTFNTGTAKHLFCRVCGIKSFYVPRSNPNGYSINLRCVDQSGFESIEYEDFDGRNWEQNAGRLRDLT